MLQTASYGTRRALRRALRAGAFAAVLLAGFAAPVASQSTGVSPVLDRLGLAVSRQAGLEGRVLWMDGTANLERLSTVQGVAAVLDRSVQAGINTVVVDVKPLSGHVLFNSRYAPRLAHWRGFRYPVGYDLLRTVLDEGHRRNLKIYASMNVFSEGHKLVRAGPLYDRPELQATVYDYERTIETPRGDRRTLALGTNRPPDDDDISIYDSNYRAPRYLEGGDAAALVVADRVESIVDAAQAPSNGLLIPTNGYLLVGRGAGKAWLLHNLRVGDFPSFKGQVKLLPILEAPSETVAGFVNPADPSVRANALRLVEEITSNYDVDGIVFDRMRYSSLQTDFGPYSRQKFEEFLGQRLNRFPDDVLTYDPNPARGVVWGPYFKQWLEWRARNIRTWAEEAAALARQKRPGIRVAAYVGSWFPTYYTVGVNWGSSEYAPRLDWMTSGYAATGYAQLLDWICTGCYYRMATREQAKTAGLDQSFTVQAAAEQSVRAVSDAAFVYASIYAQDYKEAPEAFRLALRAAREHSQGVMLFDLSQIEQYGWWEIIQDELREPKAAPHDVPGLLSAIRELRKAVVQGSDPSQISEMKMAVGVGVGAAPRR